MVNKTIDPGESLGTEAEDPNGEKEDEKSGRNEASAERHSTSSRAS